jgi:hypothetical protein
LFFRNQIPACVQECGTQDQNDGRRCHGDYFAFQRRLNNATVRPLRFSILSSNLQNKHGQIYEQKTIVQSPLEDFHTPHSFLL